MANLDKIIETVVNKARKITDIDTIEKIMLVAVSDAHMVLTDEEWEYLWVTVLYEITAQHEGITVV